MLKFIEYKFLMEQVAELPGGFPSALAIEDQISIILHVAYSNGLDLSEENAKRFLAAYHLTAQPARDLSYLKDLGFSEVSKTIGSDVKLSNLADFVLSSPENFMKAKSVGNKATFQDLHDPHALEILVMESFELGDLVDYHLGVRLANNSSFFGFVKDVARSAIKQRNPQWFDSNGDPYENLQQVKGHDDRSEALINLQDDCKKVLVKREQAAKSALERKKQKIATIKQNRARVFASLEAEYLSYESNPTLKNTVEEIIKMNFVDLKACEFAKLSMGGYADEDQIFVVDYILSKVRALQPDWFFETEEGFIKLKRAIPKARRAGVDRVTRAIQKALEKLVVKYGRDKIAEVFETVPASLSPAVANA